MLQSSFRRDTSSYHNTLYRVQPFDIDVSLSFYIFVLFDPVKCGTGESEKVKVDRGVALFADSFE